MGHQSNLAPLRDRAVAESRGRKLNRFPHLDSGSSVCIDSDRPRGAGCPSRMSEKAWENRRFGGYHVRRSTQEDAELTHVGRGTPGGEYLRRFWHPIALAEEIGDVPLALRVLGEDLVLFRDGENHLGLLHRQCSHRGASLEYGIVCTRGIRCCYHGWLYDVDGTILETPAEPETSRVRFNLRHGAYPTREYAGLIFASERGPNQGSTASIFGE